MLRRHPTCRSSDNGRVRRRASCRCRESATHRRLRTRGRTIRPRAQRRLERPFVQCAECSSLRDSTHTASYATKRALRVVGEEPSARALCMRRERERERERPRERPERRGSQRGSESESESESVCVCVFVSVFGFNRLFFTIACASARVARRHQVTAKGRTVSWSFRSERAPDAAITLHLPCSSH